MTTWRELWSGEDGKVVYRILKDGVLRAALVPVESTTLSGLTPNTDYWLGEAPGSWPSSFKMDKIIRPAPTSAADAKKYTLGTTTLECWHNTPLEEFTGTTGNHTWTSGRRWKAKVPELRTTEDHFIYVVWNGNDFEWVVTAEDTADQVDISTTTVLDFTEVSQTTLTGVKSVDVT